MNKPLNFPGSAYGKLEQRFRRLSALQEASGMLHWDMATVMPDGGRPARAEQLATLSVVHVPGPPIEALIALSIAFVAAEIIHGLRGKPGLTARAPWIVAFSFGLLHGFGFAGALAEVGLPQKAIPIALLTFNVGVELGQILFVMIALGVTMALGRVRLRRPAWLPYALPYAIGCVAMFWAIERIGAFSG